MDNQANSEYIIVGKIGSTYGIQGWLKVFSYTEVMTDLLEYDPWYIEEADNTWSALQINASKTHGKCLIAQLAGLTSPEQARAFTGKRIAIKHSQLPTLPQNEYYWADLQGLTVINQHGETLGTVLYLIETGANDVFVIKHDGKEHAIPFLLNTVVQRVDLIKREIHVEWDLI